MNIPLAHLLQRISEAGESHAYVRGQIDTLQTSKTREGKPYLDLELVDGSGRLKLKIWSETAAFHFLQSLERGCCIELQGHFSANAYGVNGRDLLGRLLEAAEAETLFEADQEAQQRQTQDWKLMLETFNSLQEPRLQAVTRLALNKYEKKWKRAGAARTFHHAYRGGLLLHTAQMLRAGLALAPLYEEILPDLLYAGILFHDIGKLWENDYEEAGFNSPLTRKGEMLGHICMGMEVVNALWREAKQEQPSVFEGENPPAELVREHLLHLIISHHGTREFGSPVTPRTPEGWMLHYIDNLDAKIEMLRATYTERKQLAIGIYEARRPLEGAAILPLKRASAN